MLASSFMAIHPIVISSVTRKKRGCEDKVYMKQYWVNLQYARSLEVFPIKGMSENIIMVHYSNK